MRERGWGRVFFFLILALIASGCGRISNWIRSDQDQHELRVDLSTNVQGEMMARMGVAASKWRGFSGSDTFNGVMEIRRADGQLQARIDAYQFSAVKAGEVQYPAVWTGRLEPGDYTISWEAPGFSAVAINFGVREENGQVQLLVDPQAPYPSPE